LSKSGKAAIIKALEVIAKRETGLVVTIFGAGGKGLARRRAIAQRLNRKYGIVCLVPEDDFTRGSPSIYEAEYLRNPVIDLVFIYPESPGSTTEFGEFLNDATIAPKLRVLVPRRYHPIYGVDRGYLTDAYMKHLAKYGHVYAFDESGRSHFPRSMDIIVRICETTRDQKAVQKSAISAPPNNAKKLLQQQIGKISGLQAREHDNVSLEPWRKQTVRIIKKIFGDSSDQARQFESIQFTSRDLVDHYVTESELQVRYKQGLATAKATLESLIWELDMFS
jgi:hypothetical protein